MTSAICFFVVVVVVFCFFFVNCFGLGVACIARCSAGVFLGQASAIAAILDFKSRGRSGRVERATKGVGISLKNPTPTCRLPLSEILALTRPQKTLALQASLGVTTLNSKALYTKHI